MSADAHRGGDNVSALLGDAPSGIVEDGLIRIGRIDLAGRARATAAAVVLTVAAVGVFQLLHPVHVNDPGARAGMETAIALSALLSAALMLGHFKHTRRRSDLLLLGALATVSLTDFALSAVPALTGAQTLAFGTGARLGCMVLVSTAFTGAALVPDGRLVGEDRGLVVFAALAGLGIAGLFALLDLIAGPGSSGSLASSYAAISTAVGVASGGALLVAGAVFVGRSGRDDSNAGLLAGACFLFAGASIGYLGLATVPTGWLTPGDGLRLSAYAVLLIVAVRKHRETGHHAAHAAIGAERQRLARDLHDGLAQDLAVITTHAQRLDAQMGPEHPLTIAAHRVLAASRGAIVDLSASEAPTTAAALRRVADEFATRFGVEVKVQVKADDLRVGRGDLDRADREHVVRIVREAIVNAIRHGGARHIEILFDCTDDDLLLRVSDDGSGIAQPIPPSGGGFGLPAMRARAESMGGRLIARRRATGGTELEVVVATSRVRGYRRKREASTATR
jgi:signal transduction histidine kinase